MLSISIILYVLPATMCPLSGETTVFMRHLVLVILCGWLSGIQGADNHPHRITSTKCCINTAGNMERSISTLRINILKINCAPCWLYLQFYTGMHSQQNIKHYIIFEEVILLWYFSGLGVACWPLVPKFAGSNPAKAVRFLGRKNPQHAFLRRGSKAVGPMP